MFDHPNAFEYLLFDLDKWDRLSQIEKARAAVYFLKDKKVPDTWDAVKTAVELFERFISDTNVVRFRR